MTLLDLEASEGWPHDEDDDPAIITETDVDYLTEIADADEHAIADAGDDRFNPYPYNR